MFQPVTIKWQGEAYEIPADEVLGLIDTVEDHVTLDELHHMQYTGKIKRMQIAKGYAAALNYAIRASGSKMERVTADDVYAELYRPGKALENTVNQVYGLIAMLIPPEHLRADSGDGEQGKQQAASDS